MENDYNIISIVWSFAMMVTNGDVEASSYFARKVRTWFYRKKRKFYGIYDLRMVDLDYFTPYGKMTKNKKIYLNILDLLKEIEEEK